MEVLPDPMERKPHETAESMIAKYGAELARGWATDHAFANDKGPARDYWLEVIREIDRSKK